MKFSSYTQFIKSLNGLVREGWDIQRIAFSEIRITTIVLRHSALTLSYILEYHSNPESFEKSELTPYKGSIVVASGK